jgi:hypothetical protein
MNFKFLGLALIILATQSACVSMSSLQTAETLEKGKNQTTIGGGTYNSKQKQGSTSIETNLPYLEASYREGLADNLDAGVKLTIIGSYSADVKYRLVKGEKFQFSVGGGLGYTDFSTGTGTSEIKNTYLDFMIPIYASYRFADLFAIYATPRFVYRALHYSGAQEGNGNQSLGGGAAGMKIGKDWGIYAEAAYQKDLGAGSNFDLMQYNVSIFWEKAGGLLSGVL